MCMQLQLNIVVDARSFNIDTTEGLADYQDAYLARFLNEAIENSYNVHILAEGSEVEQVYAALEAASTAAFEYLGDHVDPDILKHAVYSFDAYHNIDTNDLVIDAAYNAMKGKADPTDRNVQIDHAVLAISTRQEADFASIIGEYQHFMHPHELERLNAFEEFEETREQDAELHAHIARIGSLSAARQLTLIVNQAALNALPDETLNAITQEIEGNEILKDFFHGHPLNVEMSAGRPPESEAKFYLSCYFTNLVRLKDKDTLSISRESELNAEQAALIEKIGKMRGGHDALEELQGIVIRKLYTSPSGP